MGKEYFMFFPFVKETGPYLTLTPVSEFSSGYQFIVKEKFFLGSGADDIILPQIIGLTEHLIVIISPIHDKSGFPKKGSDWYPRRER